jgi:hypothetical protein
MAVLSLGIRNAKARIAVWLLGCASLSVAAATVGVLAVVTLGVLYLVTVTRGAS